MDKFNEVVAPVSDAIFNAVMYSIDLGNGVSVPVVMILLILGAVYFTIFFKFPNVRLFGIAINVVRGKYDDVKTDSSAANVVDGDDPNTIRVEGGEGEVTAFQALSAALSATVGLGNIAGVALAIAAGGPGATFWMILAGILGMASKFTECTLGVKFREIGPDGRVYGGPMYYLRNGLSKRGLVTIGKILAFFYAAMMVGGSLGAGNMFQANQAASQFMDATGIDSDLSGLIFGIVMAIMVGIVILGGIKRIGKVAERVVPTMVVIYVVAALLVIGLNFSLIPEAFRLIWDGAFSPEGIGGGMIGVLVIGFQRAAFSSEAGVGSASVAHSAVRTNFPASEGVVALLEPFIDTVIVCTMTALVIIISNIELGFLTYGSTDGLNGVNLTSRAFDSVLPGYSYVLSVSVILFAFSTMLSWSYYGLQAWQFIVGKDDFREKAYKIVFCLFIIVGASIQLDAVIKFSDAMVFAMVLPNIIGLFLLAPVVRNEVRRYLKEIRRKKAEKVSGFDKAG